MKFYQRFLPYGVAIGSTAIALFLVLWLEPFLLRTIGAFFYIAIIVSSWYGGWRPGSVAVVLSTVAMNYWFIPPRYQFWFERPEDLVQLTTFFLVAFLINLLTSNFRDSKQKIERLRQKLAQENAELLRIAPSAAQMGMWNWDITTGKLQWSLDHELLFGLTPGTFDGEYETAIACLHPEDKESVNQTLQQAIQTHSLYQQEFRVVWADGSIHWIEARGHAFYNEAGQPIQVTGTATAIDERKQAQGVLEQQFEQQRLVMEMTQRIRRSLNLQDILQTTVDEVRHFLQCDRVIIFQFSPNWSGTVVVESVGSDWTAILSTEIYDPCFGENYVEPYKQGLVTVKSDIYNAGIAPCHLELLSHFQVRANLVVPIVKGDELWGLLIAHHCAAPRQWQSSEIDLMRQLAAQVSIALVQSELFEQVQTELAQRQQAQAALPEREGILRLFVQYAPASIAMLDRDMCYIMASQRWVDEYSLGSIESVMNRSHYEIFPEIPERWRQIPQRCLAGAIEKCDEDLFVRADGTEQWICWEIHPWYTATDEIGGIIIFSVDITKRKQVEIALRESQIRLQRKLAEIETIYQSAPIGLNVLDSELRFARINQRLAEINGLPVEAHIGHTIRELLPDMADAAEQLLRPILETGEPLLNVEITGETPAQPGVQRTWLESFLPLKDGDRIIGISTVCEEITERKQAEMALQQLNAELEQRVADRTAELTEVNDHLLETLIALEQSEERRRLALDLTHIGFWDLHLPSGKLIWNDNHFTLLGLAPDNIGPNYELWRSHIHPDDVGWVEQQFLESIENHTDYVVEYRVVHPDNSVHWVMGRGKAIYDELGQPVRSLGVLLDISDRKRAEEALRQYERIVFDIKDGIAMMNCNYIYQIANPAYLSWCNKSEHEVVGNSVRNIWGQELFDNFIQPRLDRCLSGETIQYEKWFDYPNLVPQFLSVTYTPYRDAEENISGVIVSLRDLTQLKRAEQMLELQAVITRNMAEGICLVRADNGVIVYANPKFEQMFGYDCGELNGQHVSIVNYASEQVTAQEVDQAIRSAVLQRGDFTYEVHNVKKDGTPFWCSATCSVFKHPDYGDVLVAVHQDITVAKRLEEVRKRTEEELRQSEAKFRSLSESSPLGIFMTDIQGQCIYTNPRYQAICGCTFDEALGNGWVQFIHPEDREEIAVRWSNAVSQRQEFRSEIRYVRKDRIIRFGRVRSAPIFSVADELIGYVGTVEDVTDSRAVETMKKEFISIVSHELRTPLTSIRGSLGLVAAGVFKNKPEAAQQMLDIAAHDTERLVRLVNDILDLERLESQKVTLVKQWCDAAKLLQQSVKTVQSLAAEGNITLCVESTSIQIWVDSDRIIQTLVNLVSNAIKFSPPHSTVTLSVQDQAEQVLFQVKDQGRGIPADKLDTIFGRFQQVDASDSRQKGGTGLGLAICKSIVQQHGGKIWVESVVGKGSSFYFTLPKSLD